MITTKRIFFYNLKGTFLKKQTLNIVALLCCIGAIIRLYTKFTEKSELHFEYICPDSSGYQPHFIFDDSTGQYFKQLRIQYKLDDLIANCSTELDKVIIVTNWVHNLWSHDGWNEPEKKDALSILKEAIEEHKSFRCVEYSIVAAACFTAIGIQNRILDLGTKDMETRESFAGHIVNEVYLQSLHAWVMVDVQKNAILGLKDFPLNAVELQKAITLKKSDLQFLSKPIEINLQEYITFITQYLYYFKTNTDQAFIMLVPIGAKKPTVFQKIHPLINVNYTHSVACFYPNPS